MQRLALLVLVFVLATTLGCFAVEKSVLLDDFEVDVSSGPQGTVDFGAGNGSSVEVTADKDTKNSGDQSIKVVYNAVKGGYMYVARGSGLDAKNANWQINPEDIKWEEYSAISFYMYGTNSKAQIAFDIKDSGFEIWRYIVTDDFTGWKKIVCSFDKFVVRSDWQPQNADNNGNIDYPIKIFQFEPMAESKGTLYFDTVELVKE
jgi:hypothetical protein